MKVYARIYIPIELYFRENTFFHSLGAFTYVANVPRAMVRVRVMVCTPYTASHTAYRPIPPTTGCMAYIMSQIADIPPPAVCIHDSSSHTANIPPPLYA